MSIWTKFLPKDKQIKKLEREIAVLKEDVYFWKELSGFTDVVNFVSYDEIISYLQKKAEYNCYMAKQIGFRSSNSIVAAVPKEIRILRELCRRFEEHLDIKTEKNRIFLEKVKRSKN